MRLFLLSMMSLVLFGMIPATAQSSEPGTIGGSSESNSLAQLQACTWCFDIQKCGLGYVLPMVLQLPSGAGTIAISEGATRRMAGINNIWMKPTEEGLNLELWIHQSSEPAVPVSEMPATVTVSVDGKEVYRNVFADDDCYQTEDRDLQISVCADTLRLSNAFGAKNLEMAQAKSLEILFSFDSKDHTGKEQRMLSCRLEGSAEAMEKLMGEHKELATRQQQHQADFDALVLVLSVATLAFGGVILLVVLFDDRRIFVFSAAIGAIAAVILEPVLTPTIQNPYMAMYPLLVEVGLGALLAIVAVFFLGLGFEASPRFHAQLRENLDSSQWKLGTARVEIALKDHVRRWFVTIGSATGAMVGTTLGLDAFKTSFLTWLEPQQILIAVLAVTVSFFLSGPLQAYVLDWSTGAKEPSDPSKKLADILAGGDWRSVGRFGLVALAYVQIFLLASSFAVTVKQGNSQVLATLILAVVTPAIVSYYWSAALQRSAPSILRAAAWPSVWAGAVMAYGSALVLVFNLFDANEAFVPKSQGDRASVLAVIAVPAAAILVALLQSVITTLPFAAVGGYVIDRLAGRRVMLYVGAVLAGVGVVVGAVQILVQFLVGVDASNGYLPYLLGMLGWAVGLWASGFPRLVMASHSMSSSPVNRGK